MFSERDATLAARSWQKFHEKQTIAEKRMK